MKRLIQTLAVALSLVATPALAHHAAEGIVDDEVYEMIDALVADTPHAEMTLDDLGGGMTEISMTTRTITAMENMIDDGLLDYAAMLDGAVEVRISFSEDGAAALTITQGT